MKRMIVIFMLAITPGVFAATDKGNTLQIVPNKFTYEMRDSLTSIQNVLEAPQNGLTKKEIKQLIKTQKVVLKDTLKLLRKEYSKKELKLLVKERSRIAEPKNLQHPDPCDKQKQPMTKESKLKMWLWIMILIPASIITTFLFVYFIGPVLAEIILEFFFWFLF